MKIRSVKLENFGPFFGEHKVDLSVSETAPIVLIHGENMRGKTSFLNAVKWCLYGKALDRRGRETPTFRFINYDAMEGGDFHMSVTIDYEHDGHRFQLERHVQSSERPTSDKALKCTVSLKQDGHFVATESIPEIIGNMLHEDIARFFLFDGEMLGHFEVLLSEPGREAILVKDSIEQILGLPALHIMVGDLDDLRRDAEKRQLRAVRAAKKNESLVAQAQQISNEVDAIQEDLEKLNQQLAGVEEEQDWLRQQLDRFSEIKADVREIERTEQIISEKEQEREELLGECKGILSSSWWMPVATRADELLSHFTTQAQEETTRVEQTGILRHEIGQIRKALGEDFCPVCEQSLSPDAHQRIESKLVRSEEALSKLMKGTDQLSVALSVIDKLRRFATREALARFFEKEKRVRRLFIEIRGHKRQIDAIRERLKGHDVREIGMTEEKYERCIIQAKEINDDIEKKGKRHAELRRELSELNREIQRLPEADPRTAAEVTMYGSLENIFKGAVDRFREAVRLDVEQEATKIFQSLTTEIDYDILVINEQYGLRIKDRKGRVIGDRSAGAEQVVALSLIGALNRCAVQEGPIIMDTPFGRLDVLHRKNILEFVPTMGSQVILLVQSGEFDRDRDLVHLTNRVGREYRLVRNGSPTRSRFESLAVNA